MVHKASPGLSSATQFPGCQYLCLCIAFPESCPETINRKHTEPKQAGQPTLYLHLHIWKNTFQPYSLCDLFTQGHIPNAPLEDSHLWGPFACHRGKIWLCPVHSQGCPWPQDHLLHWFLIFSLCFTTSYPHKGKRNTHAQTQTTSDVMD